MNRLLLLLLCAYGQAQAAAIIPQSVEESLADTSTTCLHDLESDSPVRAWPGGSCSADAHILSTISSSTPYPLTCPPILSNTKCFPIWEDETSQISDLNSNFDDPSSGELRRRTRRSMTISTDYLAGSVNLAWPDRMKHAIFYTDDACKEVDDEGEEKIWHVERQGTRREQCASGFEAGQFASVEFMRQDEWEVWDRRRRGVDDGVSVWGWSGLI